MKALSRTLLAVTVSLLCGCSAQSGVQVTSRSIAVLPAGANLLADAGFARFNSGPWRVIRPRTVSARVVHAPGTPALQVTAPAGGTSGSVLVLQSTDLLPHRGAGSRYVLSERLKLIGVRHDIHVELRLNYEGGGYQFYSSVVGRARPTTGDGWMFVRVAAQAALPVDSIDVYAVEILGPRGLDGTVLIQDARLFALADRS